MGGSEITVMRFEGVAVCILAVAFSLVVVMTGMEKNSVC